MDDYWLAGHNQLFLKNNMSLIGFVAVEIVAAKVRKTKQSENIVCTHSGLAVPYRNRWQQLIYTQLWDCAPPNKEVLENPKVRSEDECIDGMHKHAFMP